MKRTGRGRIFRFDDTATSPRELTPLVKTDSIQPGADTDSDKMADAWELDHAPNLTIMTALTDSDGDGTLDADEYLADSDPFDPADALRITSIGPAATPFDFNITWTSQKTRVYRIEETPDVEPVAWADTGLGLIRPDAGSVTFRTVTDPGPDLKKHFWRVVASLPLAPP